jgi:hypothetical protein
MAYHILKGDMTKFHQVSVWKSPTSGDAVVPWDEGQLRTPVFDSYQLGTPLYDIYHQLFERRTFRG